MDSARFGLTFVTNGTSVTVNHGMKRQEMCHSHEAICRKGKKNHWNCWCAALKKMPRCFTPGFPLQARVRILPYDVMGTWLNETHILSAKAHIVPSPRCFCEVVLNKSGQVSPEAQVRVKRKFLKHICLRKRCENTLDGQNYSLSKMSFENNNTDELSCKWLRSTYRKTTRSMDCREVKAVTNISWLFARKTFILSIKIPAIRILLKNLKPNKGLRLFLY